MAKAEQRIIAQFTDGCGCSATGTDDKSRLTFNRCALHESAPDLLAALEAISNRANERFSASRDGLAATDANLDGILRLAAEAIEAAKGETQ